ncbi:hypothetical protein VWY33_22545, partial [Xanthomonas citri pv. citri]
MKLALAKLTRYGWNRHVLSEEDFYRICDKEGIEVIETPLVTAGFYMVFEEQPYIITNANLRGVR